MSVTKEQVPGIPDGYELVRIGNPEAGEQYVAYFGTVSRSEGHHTNCHVPIIRKVRTWRPATPSDLGDGITQVRCRDYDTASWVYGTLGGFRFGNEFPFLVEITGVSRSWFKYCEVME